MMGILVLIGGIVVAALVAIGLHWVVTHVSFKKDETKEEANEEL